MASPSDDELDYLEPGFDPATLTVPRLRAILVAHDISYNAAAKKPQLIEIFNEKLVPQGRKLRAARARIKRTSMGITDMPSSQDSTIASEDDSAPPPRTRSTGRKTKKNDGAETPKPSTRRTRQSTEPPSVPPVKIKEPARRTVEETPFTDDNPFQSGSSPPKDESPFTNDNPFQKGSSPSSRTKAKPRTSGAKSEGKSTSKRVKTEKPPAIKQERDSSTKSVQIPLSNFRRSVTPKVEDPLEPGEEFAPEEQEALIREGAARGEVDVLSDRQQRRKKPSAGISKSAPLIVLTTLLAGYAAWWRKEKIEVGFCGLGKPSTTLADMQVPAWASILQPECEPCPRHAFCSPEMVVRCEQDFVLTPHPLSLGGLVPLAPTCEPDSEKARRVKVVADRAVEELRQRRADWECGELTDENGKPSATVEIDEVSLKQKVGRRRRRGMTEMEFENIWHGALGEVKDRDEVNTAVDKRTNLIQLSSSSLARLPIGCSIRRSVTHTLARYRGTIIGLLMFIGVLYYARSKYRRLQTNKARVPLLVSTTLDRLATQAALHEQGSTSEPWISVGQTRDDVLRDEFSAKRREEIWTKVKAIVEMNANVRANVREGRHGEVSRVWQWIGALPALEDAPWADKRRSGGRYGLGVRAPTPDQRASPLPEGGREMEVRKWDEGRPIY